MLFFLSFILASLFIIFLIDAIPQFHTWQSRIKIGRFQNQADWKQKVLNISRKWLKSTPTVKLTDNNRLVIIDVLKGNYKRNSIQAWQEAALVLGLNEYSNKTNDKKIQKEIEDFMVSKMDSNKGWKLKPTECDQAILAFSFLNCDFIDKDRYKTAFDETYQMILSLKGDDGTIAYKPYNKNYRFVDTIGFICPFLVNYGLKFNVPKAVDLAIYQIMEYQKYGIMAQENIPCHAYELETKNPAGLFGWGRGIGWFVIGLIDSWNILPINNPHKKALEEIIIKTTKSVLKFQQENGGFNWQVLVKESRFDSSTVATLCWFFNLAAQIPELREECLLAKRKGLNYLQSVTRRNGAVDYSQGDTKMIGVYSQNFNILPFTQGFVLRTLFSQKS